MSREAFRWQSAGAVVPGPDGLRWRTGSERQEFHRARRRRRFRRNAGIVYQAIINAMIALLLYDLFF